MASGYSGTPLAKKLILKDGMRVWFDGMPESVRAGDRMIAASCCRKMLDAERPESIARISSSLSELTWKPSFAAAPD